MMIVLKIVLAVLLALFVTLFALYFQALDRIGHARMQRRVGPPLHQGFYDFLKLLGKENITSRRAVGWMFNGAPVLSLAFILMTFLYIPMGSVPAVLGGHGEFATRHVSNFLGCVRRASRFRRRRIAPRLVARRDVLCFELPFFRRAMGN